MKSIRRIEGRIFPLAVAVFCAASILFLFTAVQIFLYEPEEVYAVEANGSILVDDPYGYLNTDSFESLLYYINRSKDGDYQPVHVSNISFTINPVAEVRSGQWEYDPITVSMGTSFSLQLEDGYRAVIPFSTGLIVHKDDEWGVNKVDYEGSVIIEVRRTGDEALWSTEFTSYFIGTIDQEFRLGPEKEDNVTEYKTFTYTDEDPFYKDKLSYRIPFEGDVLDDSYKTLDLTLELVGVNEWLHFEITPVALTVMPNEAAVTDGEEEDTQEAKETVDSSPILEEIDTKASETKGEEGLELNKAIVLGAAIILTGIAGAAAAAGAAHGEGGDFGQDGSEEEAEKLRFKMYVKKNFGNKIRYNAAPVTLQARITQIDKNGFESDRPDLTEKIDITTTSKHMSVQKTQMSGIYKDAKVAVNASKDEPKEKEGIITFSYAGKGGMYINHVHFQLVGDARILLEMDTANLYGEEPDQLSFRYELIDFLEEPQVSLSYSSNLVDIKLEKNKEQEDIVAIATTKEAHDLPFHHFTYKISCELVAKAGLDQIRQPFLVTVNYEGIGTAFKDVANTEAKPELYILAADEDDKNFEESKKVAYIMPLTVMKWNRKDRILEVDGAAAGNLEFEFVNDATSQKMKESLAKEALEKAAIYTCLSANRNAIEVDDALKPQFYMMYATGGCMVEGDSLVDMISKISCDGYKSLQIKGKLKAWNDYESMIEWMINYPKGTYIDELIKLGNLDTYKAALKFISHRVWTQEYAKSKYLFFSTLTKENHYENGNYDVFRPKCIVLRQESMPYQIGQFEQIQSLYHELCHVIEDMNGDWTFGQNPEDERNAYSVQHLLDVARILSDMERDPQKDVDACMVEAIRFYDQVYHDPHVLHKPENQNMDWFGVNRSIYHYVFDKYCEFDKNAVNSTASPERKAAIARAARRNYFPGDIFGSYEETDGIFKGTVWSFGGQNGLLGNVTIGNRGIYMRIVEGPYWDGGISLRISMKVELSGKKGTVHENHKDILYANIDAGRFDPFDHVYKKINSFTVTWSVTEPTQKFLPDCRNSVSGVIPTKKRAVDNEFIR